jgi:hypothetical protein
VKSVTAWLASERKAITAAVSAGLTWSLVAYFPDGVVTRPEWAALAVAVAGVLGVHSVSNDPPAQPKEQPAPDGQPGLY